MSKLPGSRINTCWKTSVFYWIGGVLRTLHHPLGQLPEMLLIESSEDEAFCSCIQQCTFTFDDSIQLSQSLWYSFYDAFTEPVSWWNYLIQVQDWRSTFLFQWKPYLHGHTYAYLVRQCSICDWAGVQIMYFSYPMVTLLSISIWYCNYSNQCQWLLTQINKFVIRKMWCGCISYDTFARPEGTHELLQTSVPTSIFHFDLSGFHQFAMITNVPVWERLCILLVAQMISHWCHWVNSNFDGALNEVHGAIFASTTDNNCYTYCTMLNQHDWAESIKVMLVKTVVHDVRKHWTIVKLSHMLLKSKTIVSIWSF